MSGLPSTVPAISKPIIIETDGVLGQLPTGGIINAGGTSSTSFTVDGKSLLFFDGTCTGFGNPISLQTVYNRSPIVNGQSGITLSSGKDFVINDPYSDGNYFTISSLTGEVTINGNLVVNGATTTINTSIIQSDHQLISPATGLVTALNIIPEPGVTPVVDLVTVRRTSNTAPVFRIDSNGNMIVSQSLSVVGLVNGVNISGLSDEITQHVAGTAYQHEAAVIQIEPIVGLTATNVQDALTEITTSPGAAIGYEFVQTTPALYWSMNHNKNTKRSVTAVYDTNGLQVIPEMIQIIDANNILVSFTTPTAGSATVMLF